MSERRSRGPSDPGRRDRLIDAALDIMLEGGVGVVSHRAVADRAQVPLGSTTYYFRDRNELLVAAIDKLIERRRMELGDWISTVTSVSDLPRRLAELIVGRLTGDRDETLLSYELYFLALRDPQFRPHSDASSQVLKRTLRRYLDEEEVDALVALVDGLMISGMLGENIPEAKVIEAALRMLLGKPSSLRAPPP